MGTNSSCQKAEQYFQDEDDFYIIEIEQEIHHPQRLSINKRNQNQQDDDDKSLFVMILDDKKGLFNQPIKIKDQVIKRKISPKILELQNKIGGDYLFGGQIPVILQQKEPLIAQQNLETILERPVIYNKKPRTQCVEF
ncbi:hypothetical protein pb186bvf_007167 [Paramecium bursaria]